MMNRLPARIVFAAISLLLLVPGAARSSCNSVPSTDFVPDGFSVNPVPQPPGYKGALGRIDRSFFVSGTSRSMLLVPDGICVAKPKQEILEKQLSFESPSDLVAVLVLPAADGGTTAVRAWADKETCESLRALTSRIEGPVTKGGARAKIAWIEGCSLDGMEIIATDRKLQAAGLRDAVKLALPSPEALKAVLGSTASSLTPRIVIAQKVKVAGAASTAGTMLEAALKQSCEDTCGRAPDLGAIVCIDHLYAKTISSLDEPGYTKDPVPCTTNFLINWPTLDASTACETDVTDVNDPERPICPKPPFTDLPDVRAWQDECGGVHVPLQWDNLRMVNGKKVDPGVGGRTGIGRGKDPSKGKPVRLPGREFVGTTPVMDSTGIGQNTDWRRPDIDLWFETGKKKEDFGLRGVVDKDDASIVHIYPQLPVTLVCEDTGGTENACFGVERQSDGKFGVVCACTDRQEPGCSCKLLTSPRYFVCGPGSGKNEGMPCTRDRHCNPGGRCDAKPHCQKPGEVWNEAKDDKGKECSDNTECPPAGDTTLTQCGYRLFDLREAIETPVFIGTNPTGWIDLNYKISPGGKKRRGVCSDGTPCGNGNGAGAPGLCTDNSDCRGRKLQVEKPKAP